MSKRKGMERSNSESVDFVRPFRAEDTEAIVELWNRIFYHDTLKVNEFCLKVLSDPNFSEEGLLIAEEDEQLIGFCLGIFRRVGWWNYPIGPEGWITAIGLDPCYRRQGIGTALLKAVESYLRGRGIETVYFSQYSPNYFFPGADDESYPGATDFLKANGYEVQFATVGMERSLQDYQFPAKMRELAATLQKEGIVCHSYSPCWCLQTRKFFEDCFPRWTYYFLKKMSEIKHDDEITLVTQDMRVIGYCQQYDDSHVGPFGIDPKYQGRKIGTLMLHVFLDTLKRKGLKTVWFKGTEFAQNYYQRAGFRVTRAYQTMFKRLS